MSATYRLALQWTRVFHEDKNPDCEILRTWFAEDMWQEGASKKVLCLSSWTLRRAEYPRD
jgi:hypothetical protein